MNEIELICNRFNEKESVGCDRDLISNDKRKDIYLSSFEYDHYEIKLCRGSLIFALKYYNKTYYGVIESISDMEPEQLLNIWRLLYE